MIRSTQRGSRARRLSRLRRTHVDNNKSNQVDKGEFISFVSHEMRSPLTSIKGYTNLILAGDAGPLNAEQQEYLRIVQSNAERLITMINDLLDISQVEAGRLKLAPVPVEFFPLLTEIISSLRPQLEMQAQRIFVEIPKPEPLVLVERDRFVQILWNLLSNAHKYSPSGGCIRIRTYPVTADSQTATDAAFIARGARLLALAVEDEGIGIAPEDQARLFTKFFRADNPSVRAVGGTGLGLTITKSLVELHGGRVWVESPLRAGSSPGTRFTITVPLTADLPTTPTR